jgi:hypothetical protein
VKAGCPIDIEPELIELCRRKARDTGLTNTEFTLCDFIASGTGIADSAADYVMLFNILHAEDAIVLKGRALSRLSASWRAPKRLTSR